LKVVDQGTGRDPEIFEGMFTENNIISSIKKGESVYWKNANITVMSVNCNRKYG